MKRNFKAKEIELKESLSVRTTVVDIREPLLETLTEVPQSILRTRNFCFCNLLFIYFPVCQAVGFL